MSTSNIPSHCTFRLSCTCGIFLNINHSSCGFLKSPVNILGIISLSSAFNVAFIRNILKNSTKQQTIQQNSKERRRILLTMLHPMCTCTVGIYTVNFSLGTTCSHWKKSNSCEKTFHIEIDLSISFIIKKKKEIFSWNSRYFVFSS